MSLDLDSIVLDVGSHDPDSGAGCVMEWASVLAGEEWSDSPRCTSPVIAAFLRSWNDALPDDERQALKRYIPRLVGTNAGREIDERLAWMAADWLVRVQAPAWLRLAGLAEQATLLEELPEVTAETCPSILPALQAVRSEAAAARAAAGAAAWDAAWTAAGDAARAAAAGDAAWAAAWTATRDAAWTAARDAARAAAWTATAATARDAARHALDPTKRGLQAKAHDLLDRMIAVASEGAEQ